MSAYLLRDMGIEPGDVYDALDGRRSSVLFNPIRSDRSDRKHRQYTTPARPPRRDDGVGRHVDVGLRRGARADRNPHHPVAAPRGAAGEADAAGLHAAITASVAALPLVGVAVAEIDDQLIDRHLVDRRGCRARRRAARPSARPARSGARPARRRRRGQASSACAQTGTPRARRDSSGTKADGTRSPCADRRQVARPLRHGALVRLAVAHDGEAGIVGHLQPFVAVGDPGLSRPRCPSVRCLSDGVARAQRPKAPSTCTQAPCGLGDVDDRRRTDRRRRC